MEAALHALQAAGEQPSLELEPMLRRVAVETIGDREKQNRFMQALLECVVQTDGIPTSASTTAVSLLFQLACSGSGTDVSVHDSALLGASSTCVVVILGFAGSSFQTLAPLEAIYAQQFSCRVVTTIATGLTGEEAEAATAEQLSKVAQLVGDTSSPPTAAFFSLVSYRAPVCPALCALCALHMPLHCTLCTCPACLVPWMPRMAVMTVMTLMTLMTCLCRGWR